MPDAEERPAPLIRPPRLLTDVDRTATRLELFFDLAYVLVIAELAARLAKDLTAEGVAVFAGLFTVAWWSWVTTTLYANRFDTNDVLYRLGKLAAAAAVLGMAASAPEATRGTAVAFTLSYLATRVVLFLLYARAYRHVEEARATIGIYLAGTGAGAACWLASLALPAPWKFALWGCGILVEALGPPAATRFGGNVPLHLEHLPERFGLFVILVLGESVASVVLGVHDTHWATAPTLVAAVCFVAVAALWWNYFDLGGAAGKRHLVRNDEDDQGDATDGYVYAHLPLTLGLAAGAVGAEQLILHPDGDVSTLGRWMLPAGAALFLLGTAAVIAGTARSWRAAWPWPLAAVPFVVAAGAPTAWPPAATAGLVAAALLAVVLAGIRAQHRGALRTTET
ncbi:low temperature requirement protein A [Dactylosporangium aurantiacum]|uniref:Low temperature requirement protein A n=1 Tax=Dactylosporangium aurantiacum TaxID=35754 RepID=A0A9Q9IQS5_9ACTN|nr:low temperature requirement protein A [Dactylosporangium aurantiacum]MDG6103204.1 low temperature requirement protein A [Dactylosporangium aurantiacum]UWZ57709.1 low temperature requirement protein A [Dactylosporangium aurantiacum]